MTKNFFSIFIVVLFVAVAGWFFYQKANHVAAPDDFADMFGSSHEDPAATVSVTPAPLTSVTLPNGLEVQDVQLGVGAEARSGNVVFAHYRGTLLDGTKFDSSYDRGQPFAFILGAGQVIKGWDLGIVGMKVGGKRKLVVPPDLGYGSRANGPIPANSTLIFEVELLEVQTIEEAQKQQQ